MVKDPVTFKTGNFNGQGTPLDMIFKFITKIFSDGRELEDEIHSMCAVTLIMALLEHLGEGLESQIHTINQFYLSELSEADTRNYKNMIIQGIMMNFWYNQSVTIQSLSSLNQLDQVFNFILNNINEMKNDFEIKRIIIGLSTLTLSSNSHQLDNRVQARFQDFMKAILFLCQKSMQCREKKQKKDEQAVEDKECEKGAIYDEDEDADGEINIDLDEESEEEDEWQLESDEEGVSDLYDSNLDKVDDILYVQDMLNTL